MNHDHTPSQTLEYKKFIVSESDPLFESCLTAHPLLRELHVRAKTLLAVSFLSSEAVLTLKVVYDRICFTLWASCQPTNVLEQIHKDQRAYEELCILLENDFLDVYNQTLRKICEFS